MTISASHALLRVSAAFPGHEPRSVSGVDLPVAERCAVLGPKRSSDPAGAVLLALPASRNLMAPADLYGLAEQGCSRPRHSRSSAAAPARRLAGSRRPRSPHPDLQFETCSVMAALTRAVRGFRPGAVHCGVCARLRALSRKLYPWCQLGATARCRMRLPPRRDGHRAVHVARSRLRAQGLWDAA